MSKKVGMFYEAMNWEAVVDKQQSIERFFWFWEFSYICIYRDN
jgi:hypothetical protein